MMEQRMAGIRVLVVEDEFLLAFMVEDMLIEEGCIVLGPFARVPDALAAAMEQQIDLALLDVNVAGEKVFPVAEVLERRGVPFVLLTGYGDMAIPADHPHWQACSKPFKSGPLIDLLLAKIAAGSSA